MSLKVPLKASVFRASVLRASVLWAAVLAGPAYAQQANPLEDVFGALGAMALTQQARDAWAQVDPALVRCVDGRIDPNVEGLIQQGVLPTDSRLRRVMRQCEAEVATAARRSEAAAAAAKVEAGRRAEEERRRAEEARRREEEARREAEAARAAAEARRREEEAFRTLAARPEMKPFKEAGDARDLVFFRAADAKDPVAYCPLLADAPAANPDHARFAGERLGGGAGLVGRCDGERTAGLYALGGSLGMEKREAFQALADRVAAGKMRYVATVPHAAFVDDMAARKVADQKRCTSPETVLAPSVAACTAAVARGLDAPSADALFADFEKSWAATGCGTEYGDEVTRIAAKAARAIVAGGAISPMSDVVEAARFECGKSLKPGSGS